MSLTATITKPFRTDPRTGMPSWISRKVTRAKMRRNRAWLGLRDAVRRSGRRTVAEAFDLAGLTLIAVGVGMFLLPLGVIVGGLACLAYAHSVRIAQNGAQR